MGAEKIRKFAFVGDALLELWAREFVMEVFGNERVGKLNDIKIDLVSAKAQVELFHFLKDRVSEELRGVMMRARNISGGRENLPHKLSTGVEAILGLLYVRRDVAGLRDLKAKIHSFWRKRINEKNEQNNAGGELRGSRWVR